MGVLNEKTILFSLFTGTSVEKQQSIDISNMNFQEF